MVRVQSICENLVGKRLVSKKLKYLKKWQYKLADAFLLASQGKCNDDFKQASDLLHQELVSEGHDSAQIDAIHGMFIRINLTLERSASKIK